METIEEALW